MDNFNEKLENPTFEGEGGWEFPFCQCCKGIFDICPSGLGRGALIFLGGLGVSQKASCLRAVCSCLGDVPP